MMQLPKQFDKKSNSSISGQALLLVVLVLSVLVVVVLAASSRSVSDVQITTSEENSARAFSAAEAGVEQALLVGTTGTTTANLTTDTSFTANVEEPQNTENYFKYPDNLNSGESATFWFVSHNSDGSLVCSGGKPCMRANEINVCWGGGGGTTPAIVTTIYYDESPYTAIATPNNYSNVKVRRYTADPDPTRRGANNFSSPTASSCTVGGTNYGYRQSINLVSEFGAPCSTAAIGSGCLLFAKVKMLYNTVPQGVAFSKNGPASPIPAQGIQIESTGTSGNSTRRLVVFRGYPEPPSVFDAAIFSIDGLVK